MIKCFAYNVKYDNRKTIYSLFIPEMEPLVNKI